MAKNQNTDNSNIDPNKRSKDEDARLEKEKLNQQKEREQRQKRRKKKMLKLQKKEQKRIKWLVNLPFMTLFKVSILFTFLSFIFFHFWSGQDIFYSILNSFFIFTLLYLGMGIIMLGIFFLLSIDKEHELKEEIRHEQSRMQEEELKRRRQYTIS